MAAAKPIEVQNPNLENVGLVLEAVRNVDNFFSMKQFSVSAEILDCLDDRLFERCYGARKPEAPTPACIAGWANFLAGNNLKDERRAAEFLGLAFPAESEKLFRPRLERHKEAKYDLAAVTREEVVTALELLLATKSIDWGDTDAKS